MKFFLVTEIFFSQKHLPGVLKRFFFPPNFFKNVPGVKRMHIFFLGGGDFGVFGAPHAPTRGSRGVRKPSYDHDM